MTKIKVETDKVFTQEQAAEFKRAILACLFLASAGKITDAIVELPELVTSAKSV